MAGRKAENLTGRKFGMLTPLEIKERKRYPCGSIEIMWLCKCDCGNTTVVSRTHLKKGTVKSCGCSKKLAQEKQRKPELYKRLKGVWKGMKQRCYNSNNEKYYLYGERGIRICSEWFTNFQNFYNWAINSGYKQGLSIDRIDVNGHYEPKNCRWVSCKIQSNNRRNNRILEFNGKKLTITEWAEFTGINRSTLEKRIKKGLPLEKVLGF